MTKQVAILAFDGCHASGVTGPLDLLHMANVVAARLAPGAPPPFATRVLSEDGASVHAANGYSLPVDGGLSGATAEIVLVPGIAMIEPKALHAALTRLEPVSQWLAARYAEGAWLAAACTGPFLLAQAGLLNGHCATTTTCSGEVSDGSRMRSANRAFPPSVQVSPSSARKAASSSGSARRARRSASPNGAAVS